MAINASKVKTASNRIEQPNLEPGPYPARLVQIIDLGLQPQRPYKGVEKPPAHELMVTYELSDAFMIDKDGNDLEDNLSRLLSTIETISFKLILAKLLLLIFFMLTCSGLFIDLFSTGQTILFGLIVVGILLYADTKSNNLNFYKKKLLNTENKLNTLKYQYQDEILESQKKLELHKQEINQIKFLKDFDSSNNLNKKYSQLLKEKNV